MLYFPYAHDCMTKYNTYFIFKFADDTVVASQITNNFEMKYRKEIKNLVSQHQNSKLAPNVNMLKELALT